MKKSSFKDLAVVLIGILSAAILIFFKVGFDYPGGDLMLILPRVHQLEGNAFLESDLFFSVAAPNYKFICNLFLIVGRMISFPGCTVMLFLLTYAVLITAIWIGVRDHLQSAWNVGFLATLPLLTGFDFIGVKLTYDMYHPQFTAYAFLFLAIALFQKGVIPWVVVSIAFSTLFHPLVGLWGIILIGSGSFFVRFTMAKRMLLLAGLFLVFIILISGSLIGSSQRIDGRLLREYINLILKVRAPHHHNPLAWHIGQVVDYGMLVIYGLILSVRYKGILVFILALSLLLTCLGIINNVFFQIPALVLAWPVRMSVTVVFVVWIFMARHLLDMIRGGLFLMTAALLFSRNATAILVVGLIAILVGWCSKRHAPGWSAQQLFRADVSLFLGLLLLSFLMSISRFSQWAPRIYLWSALLAPAMWGVGRIRSRQLGRYIMISLLAGCVITKICSIENGRISVGRYADLAWLEICDAVSLNVVRDACVVIPPEKEDFQYLSGRSAYVSDKHFPFRPIDAVEWGQRLSVLGVLPSDSETDRILARVSLDYSAYDKVSAVTLSEISRTNPKVMYCVVRRIVELPFRLLAENRGYRLYEIPDTEDAALVGLRRNGPAKMPIEVALRE